MGAPRRWRKGIKPKSNLPHDLAGVNCGKGDGPPHHHAIGDADIGNDLLALGQQAMNGEAPATGSRKSSK